jgi:5S rRNA maturation endonuclease (ribonuclease M5)
VPVDVERLLHRLGIEAKRRGKEWEALCPNKLHDDRSPSWRIRDDPSSSKHGYHHCWPCGLQGGAGSLVMHVLGISEYSDAMSWIEREAAVDQKPIGKVEIRMAPPRLSFRLPEGVKFGPIEDWPTAAREYLLSRGIMEWQVARWGLGYSVEGRLKGRIVVVSRDARGRPLRYTARSFIDSPKRYLEPEPEERANQNAMFGEQHWPPNVPEERQLVFVIEGAINGLALEAELPGVYMAATAGSSMRGLYGTKLATFEHVCVMTDPDAAGDKLASDIAETVSRHASISRLRLEEGYDQAKLRQLRPGELGTIVRSWLKTTKESAPP